MLSSHIAKRMRTKRHQPQPVGNEPLSLRAQRGLPYSCGRMFRGFFTARSVKAFLCSPLFNTKPPQETQVPGGFAPWWAPCPGSSGLGAGRRGSTAAALRTTGHIAGPQGQPGEAQPGRHRQPRPQTDFPSLHRLSWGGRAEPGKE